MAEWLDGGKGVVYGGFVRCGILWTGGTISNMLANVGP
jgi:hypothetical protein